MSDNERVKFLTLLKRLKLVDEYFIFQLVCDTEFIEQKIKKIRDMYLLEVANCFYLNL